jgi:hypothetical protein
LLWEQDVVGSNPAYPTNERGNNVDETTNQFQLALLNTEDLQFKDITDECYREYVFPDGAVVRLDWPVGLHVSESGGHRVFTANGVSHYIPKGWIHLRGEVKEGKKPFAF